MHNLDMQVLKAGLQWVDAHEVWLCTVLSTYGSSPRPPGAMMIIRKGGHHCGSLSGGCVEESFIERIDRNAFPAASQVVRYGEGGFEPDRALPCGGVLDILVEKLSPGAESRAYLQKMHDALVAATAVKKKIILPHPCHALEPAAYTNSTLTYRDGAAITLTLSTAPRLVIGGLSSVAVFCANFAVALGFETIVCEHRDDALANMAALLDANVRLIKQFPAVYLEREGCHAGTAILSLTHDPRIDDLTMMEAVNLPAFYIGAMGSKKNSLRRKARLGEYGDLLPEQISRIHAPVGLDIGSKTPSEIALSVMADIVRYKNGCVAAVEPTQAEPWEQGSLI
ncbi:MAG: XdhC family protein [Pantoea sp.]|uniref:XdhC family protein n=1 Tax=Pantoea TaxID=53335 RepID=UPI0028AB33E7|nr:MULTISPECIES: XdhC family protein [Pantoea]MDU1573565.1 XdhC family protein [Pantoea sp.]